MEPFQDFIMLDIGCNKGYESAAVFNTLDKETGVSPARVYEILTSVKQELKLGRVEGVCRDNERVVPDTQALPNQGSVTIHCFEPSPRNFKGLQALHETLFSKMPVSRSSWYLHNMAVSNTTGLVKFPADCNTELCSLSGDGGDPTQASAWTDIKSTTVDEFAEQNGLMMPSTRRVFFLKIDTEGFDPAVLAGARRLLSLQVPSLVLFEYHYLNAWKTTALRDVALDLASSGYVCFFDGAPQLTRITGCWWPSLEFKQWSNVVCAVMGSKHHQLLDSLAFTRAGV